MKILKSKELGKNAIILIGLEIENIWDFIKDFKNDERYNNNIKAMKYAEDLKNRRNAFTCPPNNVREFKEELKVIDKRLKEPLINIRDDSNHIPHPFIVQCIVQNSCEHFIMKMV
jgi:hypothetical protein